MIHDTLFRQIHEQMPIPRVDLVIVRDDLILLVKRKQEPAKGRWWLPGGRIWHGESFEEAAWRIARTETSLALGKVALLGVDDLRFTEDPFGHGKGTHSISIVMMATPKPGEVVLDQSCSEYVWNGHFLDLDPYVRRWVVRGILDQPFACRED